MGLPGEQVRRKDRKEEKMGKEEKMEEKMDTHHPGEKRWTPIIRGS